MATHGADSEPPPERFEEEEKELRTVPVFEIEGDLYQQYKKQSSDDWEMSLIWKRHTISSKAKDWGKIRAHQSRPIPALYQRGRNFEAVPAFKQYDDEELQAVIARVQRPTKSAMLRLKTRDSSSHESGEGEENKPSNTSEPSQQQALVKRLLRPTASQTRRVELTLKYRPKAVEPVEQTS